MVEKSDSDDRLIGRDEDEERAAIQGVESSPLLPTPRDPSTLVS